MSWTSLYARATPALPDGIVHNLFQGKTDSFLGHEAAVQVSGSASLRKNKELVHFKLDNDKRWCKKRKKYDNVSAAQKKPFKPEQKHEYFFISKEIIAIIIIILKTVGFHHINMNSVVCMCVRVYMLFILHLC